MVPLPQDMPGVNTNMSTALPGIENDSPPPPLPPQTRHTASSPQQRHSTGLSDDTASASNDHSLSLPMDSAQPRLANPRAVSSGGTLVTDRSAGDKTGAEAMPQKSAAASEVEKKHAIKSSTLPYRKVTLDGRRWVLHRRSTRLLQ